MSAVRNTPPQNMADPFTWTRERLRCFRLVFARFSRCCAKKTCGKRAMKFAHFCVFATKVARARVSSDEHPMDLEPDVSLLYKKYY